MSNFLEEVLQAKGSATFEELSETLRSLDSKIYQLKLSVIQSLSSAFVIHDADLQSVIQWYTEILEVKERLHNIEAQLGKDKQVLEVAHQDLDAITLDLAEYQESVALIKSLVEIVKNLERADISDYYRASKLIYSVERELAEVVGCFPSIEDHIWMKQLRARYSDAKVDVYDTCRKEWGQVIKFEKNYLHVNHKAGIISHIVHSLKNVNSFDRIWEKFLNMLWQELFKPACGKDCVIRVEIIGGKPQEEFKNDRYPAQVQDELDEDCLLNENEYDNYPSSVTIRAKKMDTSSRNPAELLFQNLTGLIGAVHAVFPECEDEICKLSQVLALKINTELSTKYLRTLILQRCDGNIEKARAEVAAMQRFVIHLKQEFNFIFPETSVFEDIQRNFDAIFHNQVKEALIVKIRLLIKSNVHDTEEIHYDAISNSELSANEIVLLRKNPALFPRCVISKSVAEIIRLLKQHMRTYPDDIDVCVHVFTLYSGLVKVPKHESDTGDLVPLTSVLIHNNCLFLAHHAGYTFEMCETLVPNLRLKASQAIAFMMRCIRCKLNELLTTAMSSVEERVDRNIDISHDFLVITAELKRLDSVMKGVLPPLGWHDILATLVDHTVNEMCSKVLTWEDISANTASELASAFTQFAVATSSLFRGDASSPREVEALTARAVRKWQRFRLLTFVLTASMKEIESKWVQGCGPLAIEFSAEEVRKLVRALFQNTDRRAAFLATVKDLGAQ